MIDRRCPHGIKSDLQRCDKCEIDNRMGYIETSIERISKEIKPLLKTMDEIFEVLIELQEKQTKQTKSKKKKPVIE